MLYSALKWIFGASIDLLLKHTGNTSLIFSGITAFGGKKMTIYMRDINE
ncbi:MAG: hypothetical protein JXR70_05630 [Spirochaetales bacterium]|nr:hypothetical protein [Spirochaetales bacterium]